MCFKETCYSKETCCSRTCEQELEELQELELKIRKSYVDVKGGKFLKKLWCCVGGSITK